MLGRRRRQRVPGGHLVDVHIDQVGHRQVGLHMVGEVSLGVLHRGQLEPDRTRYRGQLAVQGDASSPPGRVAVEHHDDIGAAEALHQLIGEPGSASSVGGRDQPAPLRGVNVLLAFEQPHLPPGLHRVADLPGPVQHRNELGRLSVDPVIAEAEPLKKPLVPLVLGGALLTNDLLDHSPVQVGVRVALNVREPVRGLGFGGLPGDQRRQPTELAAPVAGPTAIGRLAHPGEHPIPLGQRLVEQVRQGQPERFDQVLGLAATAEAVQQNEATALAGCPRDVH